MIAPDHRLGNQSVCAEATWQVVLGNLPLKLLTEAEGSSRTVFVPGSLLLAAVLGQEVCSGRE